MRRINQTSALQLVEGSNLDKRIGTFESFRSSSGPHLVQKSSIVTLGYIFNGSILSSARPNYTTPALGGYVSASSHLSRPKRKQRAIVDSDNTRASILMERCASFSPFLDYQTHFQLCSRPIQASLTYITAAICSKVPLNLRGPCTDGSWGRTII